MCRAGERRLRRLRRTEEEEEKRETPPPPSYTQKLLRDPPTYYGFPKSDSRKREMECEAGRRRPPPRVGCASVFLGRGGGRCTKENQVFLRLQVGASDSPRPLCKEPHVRPPENAQKGDHIFPSLEEEGAPGMKKKMCPPFVFFEAGFVVGYIRSISPAPP